MGLKITNEQLKQAGVLASRLYYKKYHESPMKSRRVIGGEQIKEVNTYSKQHLRILSKAIETAVTSSNDYLVAL
eukprot:645046-Hanusia_phi.AAC.1